MYKLRVDSRVALLWPGVGLWSNQNLALMAEISGYHTTWYSTTLGPEE